MIRKEESGGEKDHEGERKMDYKKRNIINGGEEETGEEKDHKRSEKTVKKQETEGKQRSQKTWECNLTAGNIEPRKRKIVYH